MEKAIEVDFARNSMGASSLAFAAEPSRTSCHPQPRKRSHDSAFTDRKFDRSCSAGWFRVPSAVANLGVNPLLDQPLPPPVAGADPNIAIFVAVPMAMPMMPPMSASNQPVTAQTIELLERLDVEWAAAMDVEKDLDRLRKMLVDMMSRLKSLNRDLNPDERLYSSREDKQDWLDARRFLRDSDNRLRAAVKEFDIGDPSSAGHKRHFEGLYSQFVQPRLPFDGMEQALNGFEFYRKLLTTLHGKMNSVYLAAQSNAERRAQMVLARIANKVREAGNKKTALGVVMDG